MRTCALSAIMMMSLVLGTSHLLGDDASTSWMMSADQRQIITALVDRAVSVGLPDSKGGQLCYGSVIVNGRLSDGFHILLPNGSLIVNLSWPIDRDKEDTNFRSAIGFSDVTMADSFHVSSLAGEVAKEANRPNRLAVRFVPEQRSIINALEVMLRKPLMLSESSERSTAIAMLVRMGMMHAEELALVSAYELLQDDTATAFCAGLPTPLRLLPANWYVDSQAHATANEQARAVRLPDPARSLARMLAMHFRSQLIGTVAPCFHLMDPRQAAQAVRSMLAGDTDTAFLDQELARLLERRSLLSQAATPDMAGRLMTWGRLDAVPENGRISDVDYDTLDYYALFDDRERARGTILFDGGLWGKALAQYRKGPVYTMADMDALVALIGDHRTCCWLDHGRSRTIGANALRAIASIFSCDPRVLIGRGLQTPWTQAEQDATAQAMAVWWKDHRGEDADTILTSSIDLLSATDLAGVLRRADRTSTTQRTLWLDRIAVAWRHRPPIDPEPNALAMILALGAGHAGLNEVVSAWPPTGRAATLLTAWRMQHGIGYSFDAVYLSALQDAEPPSMELHEQESSVPLYALLGIAAQNVDAKRIQWLRYALQGSRVGLPPANAIHAALRWWWDESSHHDLQMLKEILPHETIHSTASSYEERQQDHVLPIIAACVMLDDQRPAPAWLSQDYARQPHLRHLRICDLTALVFEDFGWNFSHSLDSGLETRITQHTPFDINGSRAERDLTIRFIRQSLAAMLPDKLIAAGLPAVMTGITDIP
jgi:hypothetical protein